MSIEKGTSSKEEVKKNKEVEENDKLNLVADKVYEKVKEKSVLDDVKVYIESLKNDEEFNKTFKFVNTIDSKRISEIKEKYIDKLDSLSEKDLIEAANVISETVEENSRYEKLVSTFNKKSDAEEKKDTKENIADIDTKYRGAEDMGYSYSGYASSSPIKRVALGDSEFESLKEYYPENAQDIEEASQFGNRAFEHKQWHRALADDAKAPLKNRSLPAVYNTINKDKFELGSDVMGAMYPSTRNRRAFNQERRRAFSNVLGSSPSDGVHFAQDIKNRANISKHLDSIVSADVSDSSMFNMSHIF